MKHSADFPIHRPAAEGVFGPQIGFLPDAPMAMPKQVLERKSPWLAALRALIAGALARN